MRILIAEDNLFYRRMLQSTLVEWGYDVLAVSSGDEAWEVLRQLHAPKVAILDWMMPGMDGPEICRRLRALRQPEPPYVILLTSKTGRENIVSGLEAGADDYITKPFDREELRARLQVGLRIVGLQMSQAVVFAFARAVEAKSTYTQGHADRVTAYALALAARIGLEPKEKETLRRGAVIHDIGKIRIPDAILDKPGRLTPAEYELVKQHPVFGEQIVAPLDSVHDVIPLIRWHHERPDGKGYPDGVAGGAIPFLVRILSVADVYDALASKRPYREALAHADCVKQLQALGAGGGLDPSLVDCFCRIPQAELLSLGERPAPLRAPPVTEGSSATEAPEDDAASKCLALQEAENWS